MPARACAAMMMAALMTALMPASAALAGEPGEVVRQFYVPMVSEQSPHMRHLFVDQALANLEASDAMANNGGEMGCFDFGLSIDAQDYDENTVASTLEFEEKVDGPVAEVTASFLLFDGQPDSARRIVWSLINRGDGWRITDIASPASGWRLSQFDCN
ncbi:MAG: hypothetical protein WAT70_11735 [Rhizobiaceae bacterium]